MEHQITPLDPATQKLLTVVGFIDRFYAMCAYEATPEKAYEATERQYIALTGARRYASYKSFKVTKNKFLKKNRTATKKGN